MQVPGTYGYRIFLGSLLLGLAVSLGFGIRGLDLMYAVLLTWLPIHYVSLRFMKYVVPPTIEPATPHMPLRQALRELKGPIKLSLKDERLPHNRNKDTDRKSNG
jgi:hypothetical protein